jgi:hypothetical protein
MPLAAFGQKRAGPQTKAGKFQVDVEYTAVETQTSTKPSGSDKSRNLTGITKMTVRYQAAMQIKALRHDNMTSFIEPSTPAASGEFSYEHTAEDHSVSSDDLHYDMSEKAAFHGVISTGNGIGYDLPDSGDGLNSVDSSVSADGSGSFAQQIKSEGFKYDPATGKNRKILENKTDTQCQTGTAMFLTLRMVSSDPDTARPPETACTGHLEIGFNIHAKRPDETKTDDSSDNWPAGASTGSFADGKYKLSLSGATRMPKDYQSDQDGEKIAYTENLTFTATVNLVAGGGRAGFLSHDDLYDQTAIMSETALDDRLWNLLESNIS